MNGQYGCMHNEHGYFIGKWCMGHIRRLSLEYFPDASSCLQAIRNHNWTRRTVH